MSGAKRSSHEICANGEKNLSMTLTILLMPCDYNISKLSVLTMDLKTISLAGKILARNPHSN